MIAEFTDPRLVAVYDTVNAYRPGTQPDFYAGLAAELGAATIVDLGCGTGIVTCELAACGHHVVGVEPAPLMLARARARPFGDRVQWVAGGASEIGTLGAGLAIMSGHVAQFFVNDDEWQLALAAMHRALAPGGHLAFESRNPDAREWERWTADARTVVVDPVAGRIETWTEVVGRRPGALSCVNHYVFEDAGIALESACELRFRTLAELSASLERAGFAIARVHGDWDGRPVAPDAPELVVVAVR